MSQPPPGRYPRRRRPVYPTAMLLIALLSLTTFVREMTGGHEHIGWKIAPAALCLICVASALQDLRARRGAAPI